MINQQVSLENSYWKKKKTLPEHLRKMQKLVGDKQNWWATSKTRRWHKKQVEKLQKSETEPSPDLCRSLAGPSMDCRQNLPEKTEQACHSKNRNNILKRWPQIIVPTPQSSNSRIFVFEGPLQLRRPPHNIPATTNKAGHHTHQLELAPQQQQ